MQSIVLTPVRPLYNLVRIADRVVSKVVLDWVSPNKPMLRCTAGRGVNVCNIHTRMNRLLVRISSYGHNETITGVVARE